jgi:hypothetical protein
MRKRVTIPRVIIALALLTAISRSYTAPLVDLIAFPLAMSLFVIAPLIVLGTLAAPFVFGAAIWLYVRHRRGHPLPVPIKAAAKWCSGKALRRPRLARRLASARAATAAASAAWHSQRPDGEHEAEPATEEHPAAAQDPEPATQEIPGPAHA